MKTIDNKGLTSEMVQEMLRKPYKFFFRSIQIKLAMEAIMQFQSLKGN